jgi:phage terminase small subunit
MPGPLKNARHERFAQELARGKSQTDAYEVAGFKPNRGAACRLAENGNIKARVSEILAAAASLAHIDAAWVLKKAVTLHEKAMEAKAYASAKGALDLIGKHVEVQAFREQVQHSGRIEFANLSDEELEARIATLTGGAYVPRLTAH